MTWNHVANVTASGSSHVHVGDNINMQQGNPDEKCLQALLETDPYFDKKDIIDSKGGLLNSASDWILRDDRFTRWRDENGGFLWIRGDAGKGKTMLLCDIIDSLKSMPSNRLSYFFCQAGKPEMNNAREVLRGLTYGLARHYRRDRTAFSHVREEFDQTGKKLFRGPNSWQFIRKILTAILKDPAMSGTVLIIDALDECEFNLLELLNFIVETYSKHGIKWIVSSRNWPQIEGELRKVVGSQEEMIIDLEKNESLISGAVQLFINSRLSLLPWWEECGDKTRYQIQHEFTEKANNTFLWVAMVYQELKGSTVSQALDVLKDFPSGLEALYGRMMENIAVSKSAKRSKDILAVLSVVYRPLNLEELASTVESLFPFQDNIGALKDAVLVCGSFLTIRHETVFFVHQSAKDFLIKIALAEIMPCGIAKQHRQIFERSLQLLSATLRRNICDLDNPGSSVDSRCRDQDPLRPVGYACTYWVDHFDHSTLTKTQVDDPDTGDALVDDFLHHHLLHWLEALSLLRSFSKAVLALQNLASMLAGTHVPRLLRLVQDAHRFVLSNAGVIEIAPLQIYASALVFSPVHSVVRQHFHTQAPTWITKTPIVEEEWDACIQVLEGHKYGVTAIAFSPDDLSIASGSADGTLKIWDAATGVCVQTFQSKDNHIDSITFAASRGWLTSGSYLQKDPHNVRIRVWDPEKDNIRTMTESKDCYIHSSTLSPDGKWVACKSWDSIITIWEVETGTFVHSSLVTNYDIGPVTFSGDSKWLVSGSGSARCGTVTVWNSTTWEVERTLEGHHSAIFTLACSANSQLVVSGNFHGTMIVWEITTGIHKQTIHAHGNQGAIAISGDGRLLAAERGDRGEFWIWDITTGKHLQTLNTNQRIFVTLAFSSDGRRLASGKETIEIWDTTTDSHAKPLPRHKNWVSSVALSTDLKWAASGSKDTTIKVWDVETFSCKQTLTGHTDVIRSMLFLDGRRLASASHDNNAMVWDFTTGAHLRTLSGHSSYVSSVVFLPEKQQLVSSSLDGTIKVWDLVGTNGCKHSLKASNKGVASITLSTFSQKLISIHFDGKIKIWDLISWNCLKTIQIAGDNLCSGDISANNQWVAVGHSKSSYNGTIEIQNIETGLRVQSEKFDMMIKYLSFEETGVRLKTNVGDFGLYPLPSEEQREGEEAPMVIRRHGYGISSDRSWIVKDEQRLLWIPEKYRPRESALTGSIMILGCDAGQVQRMIFSADDRRSCSTSTSDRAKSRRGSTTLSAPLSKRLRYSRP